MNNGPMQPVTAAATSWFLTTIALMHPFASTGAAFGCFFFLSVSARLRVLHRIQLLIFSWGIGYASGIYWDDASTASQGAMLVSGIAAALAAALFTALYRVIENDKALPPWLETVLDRIPFIKRGPDQ